MSQLSEALKEVGQFITASFNAIAAKDVDAQAEALIIARAYLEVSRALMSKPLTILTTRKDPYKELRPAAQAFINTWYHKKPETIAVKFTYEGTTYTFDQKGKLTITRK